MSEILGIENLKKAAQLIISFGQKIESTTKDGFQVTDLFSFLGEVSQIPSIIQNKDNIVNEFKDLGASERAELATYIEQNLVLENKRVEKIIESGLQVLIAILVLVDDLKTPKEVVEENPIA
mgnify:CR=1 FL=1